MPDNRPVDPLAEVMRYHAETKHDYGHFARSLGYLDWNNQPDPFRRFAGAQLHQLPLLSPDEEPVSPLYPDLFERGGVPVQSVSLQSLSRFFEYSLALTAWKQAGASRWALRANPSSGNLHPTEGYLWIGPVDGLGTSAGLYHYAPREHGLEARARCAPLAFARLMESFPPGSFLVGLASIHWREAWKYGERAFRYCQHDVGHAIGALRLAAAALGWKMLLLDAVADATVSALLGLNRDADFERAEREHPDCLMAVWPDETSGKTQSLPLTLQATAFLESGGLTWHGSANRLSPDDPVRWEIIDDVAEAARRPVGGSGLVIGTTGTAPPGGRAGLGAGPTAAAIFRQRRSAVSFDGRTSLPAIRFFEILRRTLPECAGSTGFGPVPWDVLPWHPAIHLAIFVHRVDGLAPGLYMLVRDPAREAELKRAMHDRFEWRRVPGVPGELPLFLLQAADVRRLAIQLSCGQDIAGDSCFSLGMISEFVSRLESEGPWFYRRLFWESGIVGQVLYLEAEAAGVRGTGIGCFFDDPVHQALGLMGSEFQSLYHFTVGGPVEDLRLTTLPPYSRR